MIVLKDCFSAHKEINESEQRTELLLTIFNFLKNGVTSSKSNESDIGVLNQKTLEDNLDSLIERLEKQGINISIEIVSLEQRILFQSKNLNKKSAQSLSFPIILEQKNERIPAKIIIWLEK